MRSVITETVTRPVWNNDISLTKFEQDKKIDK